jgi:putative membrane protein
MQWVHIAVILVLLAVTLIFAVQNFQSVTLSFLDFRISAPLALLVAVIYLLGMVTGGSVWALIRWALGGTRQP